MVKTEDKMRICRKYHVYLEVIYIIGNNVMLQKQLYEICKKLNISKSDYETRKALSELEKAHIIKKQNFLYTKNKIIVLKKFAIRFLLNKESSSQVASVPPNIDKRVITSIFKTDIIIKIIEQYKLYTWNEFLGGIYALNSSILFSKWKGVCYHNMLIQKYNLNYHNQELYIRAKTNYDTMLKNLKEGRYKCKSSDELIKSHSNGIIVSQYNKSIKTENLTVDTLINSNIYIKSIINLNDKKMIEVIIVDINNNQNINNIIDGIILSCIVMKSIFKDYDIEFRFKILVWDNVAKVNIKEILSSTEANYQMNYIRNRLDSYRIDGRNVLLDLHLNIEDIRISINHIDFYSKYLSNIN